MSSVELQSAYGPWLRSARVGRHADHARIRQMLPAIARVVCLVVDVALILGAFLLAYWVRFIVPDAEATALGLEQYAIRGLVVGSVAVLLSAFHGFYDVDRPQRWFARLHVIISAVSTALVLVVTASFLLGDHQLSRVWFAVGWLFAVFGLVIWRTGAQALYGTIRGLLAPPSRVLVVGANSLGHQLAGELNGDCEVVGYVDDAARVEGNGHV